MQNYQDEVLYGRLSGNMKFVGIYYMIMGVISSLTIIGAIFGVPMFIAGSRLRDAGENFLLYQQNKDNDTLNRGFNLQNSSFFILKVFIIIGIVFMVFYLIAIFTFLSSFDFSSFPRT
ncbi:MAG TPA: DUF5362 family protein [Ignavibacteriaceae bacterium]|nr:DUF5362 family protein [Ignavibacteriaceae bacterium]